MRPRALGTAYAVALAAALTFAFSPFGSGLENLTLDIRFGLLRTPQTLPLRSDVVVVGIDEGTLEKFREPLALWHPHLADLLTALAAASPSLIALDLVLPDKSYEFLIPGYDRPLLAALRHARDTGPLVLAQTVDEQGQLQKLFPPLLAMAGADAAGLALVRPDADGTVRRVAGALITGQAELPTLLGRMAHALGLKAGTGLVDYSVGGPFDYVSMPRTRSSETETSSSACSTAPRRRGARSFLPRPARPFSPRSPNATRRPPSVATRTATPSRTRSCATRRACRFRSASRPSSSAR